MTNEEPFSPDTLVKTCCKLESGLLLHIEGLRSCSRGALLAPVFLLPDEINKLEITKELIVAKRKQLIAMLNDGHTPMDCKHCLMVENKRYGDIDFGKLDHIDLQHYSQCNLRCEYCLYTQKDVHLAPQYDALKVLNLFSEEDITWNAHVDFAGGEPTLLKDVEAFLAFFRSRKIRVLMFTNGVIYHPAIFNGLRDGSIYLTIVSLDAGTPSTYLKLRGAKGYNQVVENLARYAKAGSEGKGMLVVKYIFCDANSNDDDISAFAYTMLAVRPQKIWLNIDFSPLRENNEEFDFSKQIQAYVDLYFLLVKFGIRPFHYFEEAVASASKKGRQIMETIHAEISRREKQLGERSPDILLEDFRKTQGRKTAKLGRFTLSPFRLLPDGQENFIQDLRGKRVLIAPASSQSRELLQEPALKEASWLAFLDRNPVMQDKQIEGLGIHPYEAIPTLAPDIILIHPPKKHREEIIESIALHAEDSTLLAEYLANDEDSGRAQ